MAAPKILKPGERLSFEFGERADGSTPAPRVGNLASGLRPHRSVLGVSHRELAVGDLRRRAQAEKDGGQWLQDTLAQLGDRRVDTAIRRKHGERVVDHEAEGLSFAHLNAAELQRALDFSVTVPTVKEGGERATVTTSAAVLATSALALADVTVAYESVPSVVDDLVVDLDDNQAHTELPASLDFGHVGNKTDPPQPLKESQQYHEVGTGEDRFTALTFKDGYQRAFSQTFIERAPAQIFGQLSDLGRGAREVMEWFGLALLIDYWGSRGSNQRLHVLNLNRTPTSLFSATANTPGSRAPLGTRITNNALQDPTDLANARTRLVSMRNAAGFPVANWPEVVLVPDALWEEAWSILRSEKTPGVFNEENFWGPNGPGRVNLYSTPFLDLFTTTSWWAGRPRMQFVRKWAQRPEVIVMGGTDTAAYLHTREGFRVRIGWDMVIACREYIYWVESLAGTTPTGGA